jgi:hypothetical protein
MLPISADTFPKTTDELTAALRGGFESKALTPRTIDAEGGYPQLTKLSIDITNAQVSRENRLGAVDGPKSDAVEIGHFALFGEPVYFEKTALEARLEADAVKMLTTGEPKNGSLVLESAKGGTVSVKVEIEAMENLLQSFAAEAASKQGVDVKKTKLTLTQEGPRAISFRAEVTAKVFIMSATLALTGRLEIDDEFNARLSSLGLDGDAMVTNLAGGFLKPRLEQLEGKTIPLFAFLPGGIKLRDIQVSVAPALHVQARFGE